MKRYIISSILLFLGCIVASEFYLGYIRHNPVEAIQTNGNLMMVDHILKWGTDKTPFVTIGASSPVINSEPIYAGSSDSFGVFLRIASSTGGVVGTLFYSQCPDYNIYTGTAPYGWTGTTEVANTIGTNNNEWQLWQVSPIPASWIRFGMVGGTGNNEFTAAGIFEHQ